MNKNETRKLFALLKEFWPNKQLSEKLCSAWELALQPYDYSAVRAAAAAYAGKNKYFPDVADLTAGLAVQEPEQTRDAKKDSWMKKYILPNRKGRTSEYARQHGLTWQEAKAALEADPLEEVDWT